MFAHRPFRVTYAPRGQEFIFGTDSAQVLPEPIAEEVLTAWPHNLCRLNMTTDATRHRCGITPIVDEERERERREYLDTQVHHSPDDRMLVPGERPNVRLSPQRRRLLKQARSRSIRARRSTAEGRLG